MSHEFNFSAVLAELGWSKAEVCRRLGVDASTATRWGMEPPKYVMAYLGLAVVVKRHTLVGAEILKPMDGRKK